MASTEDVCVVTCMKNAFCEAVNFHKSTGLCQLGSADQALLQGELVVDADAVHYSTLLCSQQEESTSAVKSAAAEDTPTSKSTSASAATDCSDECLEESEQTSQSILDTLIGVVRWLL